MRGAALNWRLAVNGIQKADRSVRFLSWAASSIDGSRTGGVTKSASGRGR